ncbi:hypothetical protein FOPG_16799 [Fusarium oxysporum f. sp. conglutinans race 2 54008]|uniref:Uncharacterized protein n=3 Tax=Fusarium oxysporum f. sp. conglutinans TaxID=100902 RepID=A0A8H6GA78_FUSOX|nr:hypothetical protein FOXB_16722 [Fusarium oxysporum f. sp. conglutinans Fo5176]EXL67054.1 hypothetical protein FOPG_16799 [Fusarium oxysporum f. sp. conglutinans race 2 54008]KAF6513705.1 hypothetical protein HZS61_007030 [Fusarium oxysporum f. sp. conglutinans]KAG7003841.1 hypothetical protein FocnCong_v000249 [Fusarium oxysporum f. sp. conglutinans]KAI8398613.1 hypothetical protein FOFC_19828 [Fusarium oxysporum]
MKPTQVPAIPESSGDLDPKDMKVVVLTINFLSLKLCSAHHPAVFRPLVEELGLGPLNCAANARDDICLQLGAHLEKKGASEEHLRRDFRILLQERETPRGTKFEPLDETDPDQDSDSETVLRELNHLLKLGIVDYSKDVNKKLLAACSIGLSQLGRIIEHRPRTSLVNYCWRVQERLESFPNSRFSTSRPVRPPSAQPPQEAAMSKVLRRLEQLEEDFEELRKEQRDQDVKNNLNLNFRVDNASDGQFNKATNYLSDIAQKIDDISQKLDDISYYPLTSNKGPVGPPCTPADGTDDGQYINIAEGCDAPELAATEQQATFD